MERLPPLNAIKTFEVAARAGSFTLAASELGMSSAAVSQQIRNLETWFGKQLFVRSGNRIALTDADRLGKARPGHRAWPAGHSARRSGGRSADCALLVSVHLGHPYCAFMPPAKADRADVAGLVELLSRAAPATCGKAGAPR
ncbi:LysR family transcriptional regulator [Mesorhizobium ciceri]|uniref:LysR family transcriptional regulator n=1 Tax=Mesorhizobium ciceri TaxID=39645 RepID=UPI0007A942C9|nr:LysR family transcriptional regulator [Mesorhizobium ciceri]AMX99376.1 hypothetical protein A4R29_07655 [Mesorhizobium ciceri biovar biserrulae]